MKKHIPDKSILFLFLVLIVSIPAARGQLRFANLGDCRLENGQVIEDCKIGYRTFGRLNAGRSNAILFPTWYGGTSAHLTSYVGGPEAMLDTTRFFVIIADAFGDGVSSSPSNSVRQPGRAFPEFSIRDMVDAQHRLLTEKLGLDHLYAVAGISMGGLQTYQWMVSYPDFFDKAVPIVATPALTLYDRLLFHLFHRIMEPCDASDCPELTQTALLMEQIVGFTPEYRSEGDAAPALRKVLKAVQEDAGNYNVHDLRSQIGAICHYDLSGDGDPLANLARCFKGEALIIVAARDHMLLRGPSQELTRMTGAQLLELDTDCGHYAFACEKEKISAAVSAFLK